MSHSRSDWERAFKRGVDGLAVTAVLIAIAAMLFGPLQNTNPAVIIVTLITAFIASAVLLGGLRGPLH